MVHSQDEMVQLFFVQKETLKGKALNIEHLHAKSFLEELNFPDILFNHELSWKISETDNFKLKNFILIVF